MLLSAEIRLFWFQDKPAELEAWFQETCFSLPAAGPEKRTDVYLYDPSQTELGVKTRGENAGVEVKGLVETLTDTVEFNCSKIPIEIWSKWPSRALGFDASAGVTLHKTRWLRKFDTAGSTPVEIASNAAPSEKGCHVEWTIVSRPSGETCWTLGFEAFGRLDDIVNSLRSVVRLMSDRKPPPAPGATAASYPAWVANLDFKH
jgi:hypothetical protein